MGGKTGGQTPGVAWRDDDDMIHLILEAETDELALICDRLHWEPLPKGK